MEAKEKKILNLNESISKIRVELQNTKIKKSGKNSHAGFGYYELSDFLPKLNELMLKEGLNDIFTIENEEAKLILIKGEEKQEYKIPFRIFETPITKSGNPMMQDIQYLGALNTYYKRYLYLNAFGITDGEVIDSLNNEVLVKKEKKGEATPYDFMSDKEKLLNEPVHIGQLQFIEKWIAEGKIKEDKVLATYKVEKLEDLTFGNYRSIEDFIDKKMTKERKEKEEVFE